jgi:hypothetical protein
LDRDVTEKTKGKGKKKAAPAAKKAAPVKKDEKKFVDNKE